MNERILTFLLLAWCSLPGLSFAHDSNLATLHFIRQAGNSWVFEIKTPLYGLDRSLRHHHEVLNDGEPLELTAGSQAYKELLVDYIKSEFHVTAIGKTGEADTAKPVSLTVSLGAGRMKLDNHQSTLLFEIQNMPEVIDRLEFHLGYMADNDAQNNIVRLIDNDHNERHILNESNGFEAVATEFFESD